MRAFAFLAVATLSALPLVTGCAASTSGDEPSGSGVETAESAVRSATTARYEGAFQAAGASYRLSLKVTATAASSVQQNIGCFAYQTNAPSCQLWYSASPGTIKTELSVLAADGAVVATKTESKEIYRVMTNYLPAAESAGYITNESATARPLFSTLVGVDGLTADVPGAKLLAANGYGSPSDIDLYVGVRFASTGTSEYIDDSNANTRLSTQRWNGRVSLELPPSIALNVGVITQRGHFMGVDVPLTLAKR